MSGPTRGVHHVGLTVPDVRETAAFFVEGLGFEIVAEKPDYPALFVSDGVVMITLWQAAEGARQFDRREQVGLHHLALALAREVSLDTLHESLRARSDTTIEFPPEALGQAGARHFMIRIPGGVRLELLAGAGGTP